MEGLDFGPLVYWIIETSGLYEKKRLCFVDFEQRDAFEPLNERMDRAILLPSDLFHNGFGADCVEIFKPRLFRQGVALRND